MEAASVAVAEPAVASIVLSVIPLMVLAGLGLFLWYSVSKNMARIAADKGYTEKRWFHYCFWLGLVGILMVCAMPDKNRR